MESLSIQQTQASLRTVHFTPNARTLRKAREQVKMMVADGASLYQIKNYLSRWLYWWLKTAMIWNDDELASQYIKSCRDPRAANIAAFVFQLNTIESRNGIHHECATELARGA